MPDETRTHASHWPTAQLRFIERAEGERTLRILQQLWMPNYSDGGQEWRDVPLETPQTGTAELAG